MNSFLGITLIHHALIDRVQRLQDGGLTCRQIAAYLNDEGVTSWTGKRCYPELVFGVIRKARRKTERSNLLVEMNCRITSTPLRFNDSIENNLVAQVSNELIFKVCRI